MKKLLLTYIFVLVVAVVAAAPVKPGIWSTITLDNGDKVRVERVGDEFGCFLRAENGDCYVSAQDETLGEEGNVQRYRKIDVHEFLEQTSELRRQASKSRAERFEKYFGQSQSLKNDGRRKALGEFKQLQGVKKGLVVLVDFPDAMFTEMRDSAFYKAILNEGGPDSLGYKGSVKQYYLDQTYGKFTVDFDIAPGIYHAPNKTSSYVSSSNSRNLFASAVQALPDTLDLKQYDWDDDGEMDMVFFLYAGYSAASVPDNLAKQHIWPYQWSFSTFTKNGVNVRSYACGSELMYNYNPNTGEKLADMDSGIGTFCHEFSHCLGFPDLYDVDGKCADIHTMDFWDPMDVGCYNGKYFIPAPYTVFERMSAGWYEPTELEMGKEYILRPITENDAEMAIVYNPDNDDEMLCFQVIKNEGWCAGMYRSNGLLIFHVNYLAQAWRDNAVNCFTKSYNNHKTRYSYIPADGSYEMNYTRDVWGDLYGYKNATYGINNDHFSYTWDDGNECEIELLDITINKDGSVSFRTKEDPTAINDSRGVSHTPQATSQATYNLAGQKVNDDYKGVVIKNGKKISSPMH